MYSHEWTPPQLDKLMTWKVGRFSFVCCHLILFFYQLFFFLDVMLCDVTFSFFSSSFQLDFVYIVNSVLKEWQRHEWRCRLLETSLRINSLKSGLLTEFLFHIYMVNYWIEITTALLTNRIKNKEQQQELIWIISMFRWK